MTRRVLTTDSAGTFFSHVSAIPGAEAVVATTGAPNAGALVLALPSGQARPVQEGAVNAWVVGGRLLFAQANGALYSVPFDPHQLSVSGASTAVLDSIQMDTDPMRNQIGDITVGRDGTLLYVRASPLAEGAQPHLVRVSLDGAAEPLDPGRGVPVSLAGGLDLSPNGERLVVSLTDPSSGRDDIYVVDVQGGASTRLTFSGTSNTRPQFSPDGASIMYVSDAGGALQLWVKPADGSGAATLLVSDVGPWGGEWSPDMRWIVYRTDAVSTANRDIYAVRTDGDTTRVPLAATPASEMGPAISPDGRWLAYSSDVSGTDQVYVQPFPEAAGAVWQVSSGNGYAPRWSHDGRRIFYQNRRDQVIAADVSTAPTFTVLLEEVLFSGRQYTSYEYYHTYAVAPDDRHLFMLELPPAALGAGARLVEVQNWLSGR